MRTGTLELEVGDIDAALLHARELVQGVGGYVAAENDLTVEDRRVVVMTYRIPVDRWQDEVDALRRLADTVIAENTQAEEVTSQVVDLNARIDNLRTSEASLRDIMDRAQTVDDVLAVQQRLETVQGEIEQLVAQQQDITGRAALGTLQVHWRRRTSRLRQRRDPPRSRRVSILGVRSIGPSARRRESGRQQRASACG